jgi:hypothetical protein
MSQDESKQAVDAQAKWYTMRQEEFERGKQTSQDRKRKGTLLDPVPVDVSATLPIATPTAAAATVAAKHKSSRNNNKSPHASPIHSPTTSVPQSRNSAQQSPLLAPSNLERTTISKSTDSFDSGLSASRSRSNSQGSIPTMLVADAHLGSGTTNDLSLLPSPSPLHEPHLSQRLNAISPTKRRNSDTPATSRKPQHHRSSRANASNNGTATTTHSNHVAPSTPTVLSEDLREKLKLKLAALQRPDAHSVGAAIGDCNANITLLLHALQVSNRSHMSDLDDSYELSQDCLGMEICSIGMLYQMVCAVQRRCSLLIADTAAL